MISFLFKLLKRVVSASLLIYSFDVFFTSLNCFIPLNFINISLISFFGFPALMCLSLFSFLM